MYCFICHAQDREAPFNRDVVAICLEFHKPVCQKHAQGCVEDGHGYDPLPTAKLSA